MDSCKIKEYRQIHNQENFFLDSAVYSIGEAVGFTYEEGFQIISAITGDLFAYMYSDEKYCDSGMTNCLFLPETIVKAYEMFGYTCLYLSREDICGDIDGAAAAVRASVDRGIPVLAWGCGGVKMHNGEQYDPLPEGCLIGGYEGEEILYVNLYPGEERLAKESACGRPGVDEYGYTAVLTEEALRTTYGIFIVGEKITPKDMREVYKEAIASIPGLLTKEPAEGYLFGRAAFEKWAKVLRKDAYWLDAQMAETNCWDRHCHAYCAICTSIGMGSGEGIARFIRKAADALPDMPEAAAVLPYFERLHECSGAIWEYQGGFMPPFEKLAEHDFREHLAGILCEMGAVCEEIVKVFKRSNIASNVSGLS